jgi:hypothetical protein
MNHKHFWVVFLLRDLSEERNEIWQRLFNPKPFRKSLTIDSEAHWKSALLPTVYRQTLAILQNANEISLQMKDVLERCQPKLHEMKPERIESMLQILPKTLVWPVFPFIFKCSAQNDTLSDTVIRMIMKLDDSDRTELWLKGNDRILTCLEESCQDVMELKE